jgi:hypothetical protein
MNTQETNELQNELNELNDLAVDAPVTEEKRDVIIEVTGFTLFADVKL